MQNLFFCSDRDGLLSHIGRLPHKIPDQSVRLANPNHHRRPYDNDHPVLQTQWGDVEEIVEQSEAKLVYNGRTVSVVGAEVARISVFSTSGMMVADIQQEKELNVMPLVNGIYIVRAVDIEGNVLTTKFIKR